MMAMVGHQQTNQKFVETENVNSNEAIIEENIQNEREMHIDREKNPFNEFINNNLLLYSSFPFLFLFGKGLKQCGSVDKKAARHMLLQFNASFSNCHRFIFLLFDQLQRHAASRVIASRVKCNAKSFELFVKLVNEPNFTKQLQEACKNPSSKESIDLLKKLSPHIVSCTSRIPFTSAQRSAEIMNLVAMRYFYGMPCIFITYAPDDIHGVLNIRLSIGQKNNENFPSDGNGLASAIQNGESVFKSVPIAPQDLRILLAKGPIASAEIFRILTEIVFKILLNTAPDYCTKRTVPLPDREPGI